MLAGLDDEPTVVDTTKPPRLSIIERDAESGRKTRPATPSVKPGPPAGD